MRLAIIATLAVALGDCGGGGVTPSSVQNPCTALCDKQISCGQVTGLSVSDCASLCTYGGNYEPGLAPTPVCPQLAAQESCVAAAVAMSCDAWQDAMTKCPSCPPLDGSPCAADFDCLKYRDDFRCDLSRPGGYCTAPCQTSDDCSAAGPEICTVSRAPSFSPQAPATQGWCLLGCTSDGTCRTDQGYSCVAFGTAALGVCDTQ